MRHFPAHRVSFALLRQALLYGADAILPHIELRPGMRILDAGCGSGWVARLFARSCPDAEIVGLDINEAYLDYAAAKAAEEGLSNIRFEIGDLCDMPFASSEFDAVWSQFTVIFLPKPALALAEFTRITQPGGQVLIRTHDLLLCRNDPPDHDLQPKIGPRSPDGPPYLYSIKVEVFEKY